MFPTDVEEECLWSFLEDLVWASVRCGEWLTMTIRANECLGKRGEVLWYVGFSVGAVCCSHNLFLLGRIFLQSAEGDGGLLGHWLQGRIQQG